MPDIAIEEYISESNRLVRTDCYVCGASCQRYADEAVAYCSDECALDDLDLVEG